MQAVQGAHAALVFSVRHPDVVSAWARDGGSLLFLAAADELALCWLLADAQRDAGVPQLRSALAGEYGV